MRNNPCPYPYPWWETTIEHHQISQKNLGRYFHDTTKYPFPTKKKKDSQQRVGMEYRHQSEIQIQKSVGFPIGIPTLFFAASSYLGYLYSPWIVSSSPIYLSPLHFSDRCWPTITVLQIKSKSGSFGTIQRGCHLVTGHKFNPWPTSWWQVQYTATAM